MKRHSSLRNDIFEPEDIVGGHFVAIWIRRNTAVPKKYDGRPRANGTVDRRSIDLRQNMVPASMNIADII